MKWSRGRGLLLVAFVVSSCGGDNRGNAAQASRGATIKSTDFDGEVALGYIRSQLAFGPRVPGTPAHVRTGDWITAQMRARADTVLEQRWTHRTAQGKVLRLRNIFARYNVPAEKRVLLLAHWDTRPTSDAAEDSVLRTRPFPGANDGGSGVAVLMALADQLKKQKPGIGVDLLFVDGEDYGDFATDTDVLLGAKYFAEHMSPDYKPLYGILLDMVGDADLKLPYEGNSLTGAPEVVQRVWGMAKDMGYESVFVPQNQGPVTDDHLPFLKKGLRVIDVVDIDYCCHHKPTDAIDRVSAKSLKIVGDVMLALIRGES